LPDLVHVAEVDNLERSFMALALNLLDGRRQLFGVSSEQMDHRSCCRKALAQNRPQMTASPSNDRSSTGKREYLRFPAGSGGKLVKHLSP
jgi:hypothetical protein